MSEVSNAMRDATGSVTKYENRVGEIIAPISKTEFHERCLRKMVEYTGNREKEIEEVGIPICRCLTDNVLPSAADVLRDIYHNMIGHEKYLAAYILGKNFKIHFSKLATAEELAIFLNPINQKLDLSYLLAITDYLDNIFKQQKPGASPAYSIKKIIDSNFEENDKIFTVFYYALM